MPPSWSPTASLMPSSRSLCWSSAPVWASRSSSASLSFSVCRLCLPDSCPHRARCVHQNIHVLAYIFSNYGSLLASRDTCVPRDRQTIFKIKWRSKKQTPHKLIFFRAARRTAAIFFTLRQLLPTRASHTRPTSPRPPHRADHCHGDGPWVLELPLQCPWVHHLSGGGPADHLLDRTPSMAPATPGCLPTAPGPQGGPLPVLALPCRGLWGHGPRGIPGSFPLPGTPSVVARLLAAFPTSPPPW